jgi:hypothetical protein
MKKKWTLGLCFVVMLIAGMLIQKNIDEQRYADEFGAVAQACQNGTHAFIIGNMTFECYLLKDI